MRLDVGGAAIDEAEPSAGRSRSFLDRHDVRLGILALGALAMVLPALVAIAALAGRPWYPADDFAVLELRMRDVLSWNTPLTGFYSRPGWNHLGPLTYWLKWPLYAASGGAPWATRVGGAVTQTAAFGWLAWLTWRHSLRMLLAALTVTILSFLAFGPWLFRQPWDPNVVIPVFILFIFLTCITADGQFRQLIAMTLVANVIVQMHLSYAALVVTAFAWAIACTVWDARRHQRAPDRLRSTVLISLAVTFVVWILPALDVLVNWPGNIGKVVAYFAAGGHQVVGLPPRRRDHGGRIQLAAELARRTDSYRLDQGICGLVEQSVPDHPRPPARARRTRRTPHQVA